MALSFLGTTAQYLMQNVALLTTTPISFACWYNPSSVTVSSCQMCIGSTTASSFYDLLAVANNTQRAEAENAGTGAQSQVTTSALAVGTWVHLAGVFTSVTLRTLYVNAVPAGINTVNISPSSLTTTAIGATFKAGPTDFCHGTIAYPAIWNTALTQADVTQLYAPPFAWNNNMAGFNWSNSGAYTWTNNGLGSDPRDVESAFLASFSLLQNAPPFYDSISGNPWLVTGSPTVVADPFPLGARIAVAGSVSATATSFARRVLRPISRRTF